MYSEIHDLSSESKSPFRGALDTLNTVTLAHFQHHR